MDSALKEAMIAYRARWEEVAVIEAEELRRMTIADRLQKFVFLVSVARALKTFDDTVLQNEIDAEPVRLRWRRLKGLAQ